jgi:hypothetical protein
MATKRFATANPSLGGSAIGSRFHPELSEAPLTAFKSSLVWFELLTRVRRLRGWEWVIARNNWFQRKLAFFLYVHQLSTVNSRPTLFSYSYSDSEGERAPKVMAPDDGNHLCPLTF